MKILNPGRIVACAAVAFASLTVNDNLRAQELPLWEVGIGPSVISLPYYRGAASNNTVALPFLYPVYRGERFRVDDKGVRGKIFHTDRVRLDISADANTPGDSDDIEGRDGMSDLDPTVQVGPSLEVKLWEKAQDRQRLTLNLPVRGVFALDSGLDSIGYTFSPHLTWNRNVELFSRQWRLGVSGGFQFGSRDYHDYYYSVAPEFARAGRAAYSANSGYGGTRFTVSLVSRNRNNFFSVFARYDRLDNAEFEDSPLKFRDDGLTVGFAFAWFLWQSDRTVKGHSY